MVSLINHNMIICSLEIVSKVTNYAINFFFFFFLGNKSFIASKKRNVLEHKKCAKSKTQNNYRIQ